MRISLFFNKRQRNMEEFENGVANKNTCKDMNKMRNKVINRVCIWFYINILCNNNIVQLIIDILDILTRAIEMHLYYSNM